MRTEEILIDYAEAAKLLGVKRDTLYSWVSAQRIPHIRLGPKLVRFDPKALADWLASQSVAAGAEEVGDG